VIDEFGGSDWHYFVNEGCFASLSVCFEYLWCFAVADSGLICEAVVAAALVVVVTVVAVVVSLHDFAYYFGTDLKQN